MKTFDFDLCPQSGWDSFLSSPKISSLVHKTLNREKSADRWRYFCFTSDTSWWRAEEAEINQLYIEYKNDLETISKLVISLTECNSLSFRELKGLMEQLISEFDLKETELTDQST